MKHVAGLLALLISIVSVTWAAPVEKKLVEYGWDVPAPSFVAEHIRAMEERPFDGVIMRMPGIGRVFAPDKFSEADYADELAACEKIQWERFTDNFMMIYAASTMDWFDDSHWEAVVHNTRLVAKAAALARCTGICFDAEPYGDNPWMYSEQARAQEKSFAEYEVMVRARGAQFIDAIEAELPDPVIHTFWLTTIGGLQQAAMAATPEAQDESLAQQSYGLYPAFINGMMDAMDEGTILNDGNESSYYYTTSEEYFRAFHYFKQGSLGLIDPAHERAWRAQTRMSQALYVDHLFGVRTRENESHFMTEEERAQWFEHDVYWALKTTDKHVWLYSEKMNWWLDKDLPPGLEDAVISARAKVAAGEPLGFDLEPVIDAARQRQIEAQQARLVKRSATVARLPQGQAPAIDGTLDDAIWQQATALEAFVQPVNTSDEPSVATTGFIAWDAEKLYVAVRCEEPKMDALDTTGGETRDASVWLGDSVDLFISAGSERVPYFHFITNPAATRWDGKHSAELADLKWDPDYELATATGDNYWSVEWAIPWSALGMQAPATGAKLFGNVCRQRRPVRELSSWTMVVKGFVEPGSLGELTF